MGSKVFSLEGKSVLITGGTGGMGQATAQRFVEQGARVVISGRRSEGSAIASRIGCEFVAADLSQPEQISAMVEAAAKKLVGLDAVICLAGEVIDMVMIEDTDDALLQRMFEVNMLSHYRVMRSALPHLRDGGAIVFNATLLTRLGNMGETAYGAAKAGLVSLTQGAAMELAPRGIRVNLVSPGPTEGAMWPEDHPQREIIETLTPIGRFCQPDEIAALCHFLVADDCACITGANIHADGGVTAGFAPQMLGSLTGE
jgi:NAD(P)-dependent dehydrogenase (short-subunit alcohol dehydrogenase family)